MDLIRRQDAIDAIEKTGLSDDEKDTAIRVLQCLPSAQQWIPCSERLPKDKQRVIIQMYNGYMEIIEFSAIGLTDHILAWMPMPEPYKGGK